jgi:hypothetical protein
VYQFPSLIQIRVRDTNGNVLLAGTASGHTLTRNCDDSTEIDLEINTVAEANPSAIRCMVERRPTFGTVIFEPIPLSPTEEAVRAALESKFRQGTVWAATRQQEMLRAYVNSANPQNADRILRDFENQFPAIKRWREQIADRLFRTSVSKDTRGYCGSCIDGRRTTHYFDLGDQW